MTDPEAPQPQRDDPLARVLQDGPATFFNRSWTTAVPPACACALLGVPWDDGNGGRQGANMGPRGIRNASTWFLGYDARNRRDLWEVLPTVDGGDIAVVPADPAQTVENIEAAVGRLCAAGVRPLLIGGNHSITIGATRGAAGAVSGSMGYLVIDTHLDTASSWNGSQLSSASPARRTAEIANVDPANICVFGVHGWLNPRDQVEAAEELGITWMLQDEIRARGLDVSLQEALERVGAGTSGVYVSFDLDSLDAGVHPGTGTPEPGGFSSHEALRIARALGRIGPVAIDVVESAPMYDPSGSSARLACAIILELLSGVADSAGPRR